MQFIDVNFAFIQLEVVFVKNKRQHSGNAPNRLPGSTKAQMTNDVCTPTNCILVTLLPTLRQLTFCTHRMLLMSDKPDLSNNAAGQSYRLDSQVGFLLRRAQQRHLSIFSEHIPDFTPTQFAAMARLHEAGALSQNELGRQAAMDAATIKGVIDRLRKRGLISTRRDERDQRRIYLDLTAEGRNQYHLQAARAAAITAHTVSALSDMEHEQLVSLLKKLV